MQQTCNDAYWEGMEKLRPKEAPCGRTFDDVDHWTFCPHDEIPNPETRAKMFKHALQRGVAGRGWSR